MSLSTKPGSCQGLGCGQLWERFLDGSGCGPGVTEVFWNKVEVAAAPRGEHAKCPGIAHFMLRAFQRNEFKKNFFLKDRECPCD